MKGQAVENPIINMVKTMPVYDLNDKGYVYVIDNGENIKVGSTTNLYDRMVSLSNSNGGGFTIKALYYSPANYIYKTLEKAMHLKLKDYQLVGEWFNGIPFIDVCNILNDFVNSASFKRCDAIRKHYNSVKLHNTTFEYEQAQVYECER